MEPSLYEAVVETMQDGLLVVDTQGLILAVNPAFQSMTGYSTGELVGKPCTVLNCTGCEILGGGGGRHWCALFLKGSVRNRRCQITRRDGNLVHVNKSATVLHDKDGSVTGAVETLNDITELVKQEEEIASLRLSLMEDGGSPMIVGNSEPMRSLLRLVEKVARSDAPVLIQGESGVGKELVARAIHDLGRRADSNFIKVSCASLNENLLESELFGHVKGAFTGAARDRIGRFEAASGGSIFLDEIGDISAVIQVKLLRVLEAREVERVGDHRPIPVDARIITATNKNLEEWVDQGGFRADLFYRINVVPVFVPPLRQRKEDIPLLAQGFVEHIAKRSGRSIEGLTSDAVELLMGHDWPGNVRELRNVIEYGFVVCHEKLLRPDHLATRIPLRSRACGIASGDAPAAAVSQDRAAVTDARLQELQRALEASGGNRTEAARILGVSRVALWKRMKKYGMGGGKTK
jgi:two-component system, NtrC family, response regulator HydG